MYPSWNCKFYESRIGIEIIDGINEFMDREGIKSLDEIRGII
ncbi:dihydroorotate dehydrogenase B (NAD(+)), catalytic subunit domain protein [Clostridioides difficile 342]|nr:dihydroorotate dehydrogenase B (NAD(+)), catalytic subunit domain protein [Clostridioides difficile 342]